MTVRRRRGLPATVVADRDANLGRVDVDLDPAAFVVALGSLLGGAVAVVALLSIRDGLSAQVGAAVDLVVPWPTIGAVVSACLVLAVVASVVPTRGATTSADNPVAA